MSLSKEQVFCGYANDGTTSLLSAVAEDIVSDKTMLEGIKGFCKKYGRIRLSLDFDALYVFVRMHSFLKGASSVGAYDTRFGERYVNFHCDRLVCRLATEAMRILDMDPLDDGDGIKRFEDQELRENVLTHVNFWVCWIQMYANEDPVSIEVEEIIQEKYFESGAIDAMMEKVKKKREKQND